MVMSKYAKRTFTVTFVRFADIVGIICSALLLLNKDLKRSVLVFDAMSVIIGCTVLSILIFPAFSVYRSWRVEPLKAMLYRVTVAWFIVFTVLLTCIFMFEIMDDVSRLWLFLWFLTVLAYMIALRIAGYFLLIRIREQGRNSRSIVLIGRCNMIADVKKIIRNRKDLGFRVDQVFSLDDYPDSEICGSADYAEIVDRCNTDSPDELWFLLPIEDAAKMKKIMKDLKFCIANIRWIPAPEDSALITKSVADLSGYQIYNLAVSPFFDLVNRGIKRTEDIVLASIILLLISPLMIVISLIVKFTSSGPVFFRQERHGLNGKIFYMLKFRSMKVHKEKEGTVTQATKNDSRITPVGAFLRKTSLDELPQFLNVLKGDMSIVGPRPHAVAHNVYYREFIDSYMQRHKVKPGITGWAQVNGWRGETDTMEKMEKRVEFDLYYIENWSVALDLRIIFMTIFKGFINKNAY